MFFREKPGEPEWKSLEDMKVPFLLNYAQCKLFRKDYYPVIEHASTVLKRDPGRYYSERERERERERETTEKVNNKYL